MRQHKAYIIAVVIALLFPPPLDADVEPDCGTTLSVRLSRPDRQLEALLALFETTPFESPADALAAWREKTGQHDALNKATQALIALLNPEMQRELAALDGAWIVVETWPPDLAWSAAMHDEEGIISALATAIALTDGTAEAPHRSLRIDRMSDPNGPWLATGRQKAILASSRSRVIAAVDQESLPMDPLLANQTDGGWQFLLKPRTSSSPAIAPPWNRIEGVLVALGCQEIRGIGALRGETLSIEIETRVRVGEEQSSPRIEPEWLSWMPSESPIGAIVIALDGSAATTDRLFRIAEAIQRTDPNAPRGVPLRIRVNLAALAMGILPDRDFWPELRGLGVFINGDPDKPEIAVTLHTTSPEAAQRLSERVILPVARLLLGAGPESATTTHATDPSIRTLGARGERPVELSRSQETLLLTWGEGLAAKCLRSRAEPGLSAAPSLLAVLEGGNLNPSPQRLACLWPARLLRGAGTDFSGPATALPPLVWWGTNEQVSGRDVLLWSGLGPAVVRTLAELFPEKTRGVSSR